MKGVEDSVGVCVCVVAVEEHVGVPGKTKWGASHLGDLEDYDVMVLFLSRWWKGI